MASYRFSASIISRSSGRSATGAAAYRAATRIECDRYGTTHDFTRKGGVLHSEIMAPDNAPDWMHDRAALWNAVEAAEKRKDAQLAREIQLSLPHEMTDAQRLELVREFIAAEFVARGMVADFAIHAPGKDGDDRNHHAHVMLTMRELDGAGFGKKVREWNDPATLTHWREAWADHQNREAERLNLPFRVDHRSFEAQGIDREPEQHEGPHASAMKRKGQETRIGKENAERAGRNSDRAWQHVEALKELAKIAAERARYQEWSTTRIFEIEARQRETLFDLERQQDAEKIELRDELENTYGEHLRTVQAEADKAAQRLNQKGVFASLRRVFKGREDRDRLEMMTATLADTRQRIAEKEATLKTAHDKDRARVVALQEQRRDQQHEGIDKSSARKMDVLQHRENAARALWDTAKPDEQAKARQEWQRRAAWYAAKQEEKAPDRSESAARALWEPAPPQSPKDRAAEARRIHEGELYDRFKGKDTTRDNSRLHVSKDILERVERERHNAGYEKRQQEKRDQEAPQKAAELERLRQVNADRQAELDRQPQPPREAEIKSTFLDRAADVARSAQEAARALWMPSADKSADVPAQEPTPKPEPERQETPAPKPDRSPER